MPSISLKTSIKTLIFNTSICILIDLKLLNISSTNSQLKSHLQIFNPFCWIGIKQKHFVFQWSILIGECCYYGCENGPQLCLPVYGTHWIFIAVYNNTRNQWLRSSTLPSCCYIYLIKYLKRPTSFWKWKSLYNKEVSQQPFCIKPLTLIPILTTIDLTTLVISHFPSSSDLAVCSWMMLI